jgi:hypothetical protein
VVSDVEAIEVSERLAGVVFLFGGSLRFPTNGPEDFHCIQCNSKSFVSGSIESLTIIGSFSGAISPSEVIGNLMGHGEPAQLPVLLGQYWRFQCIWNRIDGGFESVAPIFKLSSENVFRKFLMISLPTNRVAIELESGQAYWIKGFA